MRSIERTALVNRRPLGSTGQGERNVQQGGIDLPCSLQRFDVDREIDQGVERANGADIERFGSLDAQVFGLAVDAFA